MTTAALMVFAALLGGFVAWTAFRPDLRSRDDRIAELEHAHQHAWDVAACWEQRAVDAETSLQLVLDEGHRHPLTAPANVVPLRAAHWNGARR